MSRKNQTVEKGFLRRRLVENAVILGVPALLSVIYYFTPISFQVELALYHPSPQLHTFWTNSLVHENKPQDSHLVGNIVAYLLLVFPCWGIYIHRGEERRFWIGFITLLGLTPIVASVGSYYIFSEILNFSLDYSRGFSGVVGSIDGFLIVTILSTFELEQTSKLDKLSAGIYLATIFSMLGLLNSNNAFWVVVAIILLAIYAGYRTDHVASLSKLFSWMEHNTGLGILLFAGVFLSALVFAAALPDQLANSSGGFTNVFVHGIGIVFGMLVGANLSYLSGRKYD